MKYTPKFFKENLPEWKRKKDPLFVKILYRPISFYTSSLAAEIGINANQVSYFSALLGIVASILFVIPNFIANIIGAILINIWIILDCTDGNLARSVKKVPFGEFADGISSYILVSVLYFCIGINVYINGGLLVNKGCIWMIIIGAIASHSDTLMRLIHQKYINSEKEMMDNGIIKKKDNSEEKKDSKINSIITRIKLEFGIGGIMPIAILISTIFGVLDIIVVYAFVFYLGACIFNSLLYIYRAIKKSKQL